MNAKRIYMRDQNLWTEFGRSKFFLILNGHHMDHVISVFHNKFDTFINTLNILFSSTDRVTRSNAHIFSTTILSFNFILILKW